jgi:hypothetical protein
VVVVVAGVVEEDPNNPLKALVIVLYAKVVAFLVSSTAVPTAFVAPVVTVLIASVAVVIGAVISPLPFPPR